MVGKRVRVTFISLKGSKYQPCPQCRKKGLYKTKEGDQFKCRYCPYSKFITPGQDW